MKLILPIVNNSGMLQSKSHKAECSVLQDTRQWILESDFDGTSWPNTASHTGWEEPHTRHNLAHNYFKQLKDLSVEP